MPPRAADRPYVLMELTAGQQDRIRWLLETELRRACRSAVLGGTAPAEVAGLLATQRRALAESAGGLPHDPEHPADDPGESRGIAERR